MSTTRDLILIILVLLLTGALIVAGVQQYTGTDSGHGSIHSGEADGVRRFTAQLSTWGYIVTANNQSPLLPDAADTALFVLGINEDFDALEAAWLPTWVQAGGTLLIAQDNEKTRRLLQLFDVDIKRTWRQVETAPLQLPAFNWPLVGDVTLQTRYRVDAPCGHAAIHLGDCDTSLLVSFGYGRGQVIVLSSLYPFTNEGIQVPGNLQFVANLVGTAVPSGSRIRFDETHRVNNARQSRAWLWTTPTGWGLLYTLLLLLTYGWWQGRSLSTAVPITPTTAANEFAATQSTDEFITDMARLYQQSSQEKNIQRHFWQRLKRQLARQYRCDYNLPDTEFFAELLPYQDEVDIARLLSLHAELQRPQITESQLLWWVTQVVEFTEALPSS